MHSSFAALFAVWLTVVSVARCEVAMRDSPVLRTSVAGEFGSVSVVETDMHRVLLLGTVVLGAEYLQSWARDQAAFSGMALMQTIAFIVPAPQSALCLGLGVGTAPEFLRSRGIQTDIVERDVHVIELAQQHFAVGERPSPGRLIQADVFLWLLQHPPDSDHRYDAILHDLFDGQNPAASLSRAHFEQLKASWLRPGGVLALNLLSYRRGRHALLVLSAVRSLRHVFSHVRTFADHDLAEEPDEPCNLLTFASDAPVEFRLPTDEGFPKTSSWYVHSHFTEWEEHGIGDAVAAGEGEVLADAVESPALGRAQAAVSAAMRELQENILPPEGWLLLNKTIDQTYGGSVAARAAPPEGRDEL